MTRMDCTAQTVHETFRALIQALNSAEDLQGFEVDHFHAVDLVELAPDQYDYDDQDQVVIMKPDGSFARCQKFLVHLNLDWDVEGRVIDAAWSEGSSEIHPLDQDPRGFFSLVADEWHER